MKIFYSKSAHGFFADISSRMPRDAVEISSEEHASMLRGQAEGMEIVADSKGRPSLRPRPAPTELELADCARAERDILLKESDWVALHAMEARESVPAKWEAYRKALRDVPQQAGFPNDIEWPEKPEKTDKPNL